MEGLYLIVSKKAPFLAATIDASISDQDKSLLLPGYSVTMG